MIQLSLVDLLENNVLTNLEIEKSLASQVADQNWILRFWQNKPSIILGRFQREEYEVMSDYLKQHNITLCRRETGGGTVYHDLGTLNVSFVKTKNPPMRKNIKDATVCTEIIANAISKLGINVSQNDRNALFVGDLKILGSAAALSGNISHYHCSILYDTNLEHLNNSINQNPVYKEDDSTFVKSHRSPVTNLKILLPQLTMDELKKLIHKEFNNFTKQL